MSFVIVLLTVVMVLTCLLLILLVLIQLPKKEAGAGLAFGGSTTDALFGAGSGNVLTKVTKYAIGLAFLLWMVLGGLQSHFFHREVTGLEENYGHQERAPMPATTPYTPAPSTAPAAPAAAPSNSFTLTPPAAPTTSAAPATVPAK